MELNIKNFDCLGSSCPNHCCGAFDGITPNLKSVEGRSFSDIILTPEDERSLREGGYDSYIVRGADGVARIKTAEDGTCSALKDGKCLVYEHRPSICKAYPLYLDMFSGLCFVNECVAFTEDIDVDDCRVALGSLLDLYEFWIDHYRNLIRD